MTQKITIVGLVALAFVTGTLTTEGMAFAAQGEPKGAPFRSI